MTNSMNSGIKMNGEEVSLQYVLDHVGKGWHPLVTKLIENLFKFGWDGDLHQIKEKFGGLRFYIGEGNDAIYTYIDAAEMLSLTTCEICGKPGSTSGWGRNWIRTLCKEHGEEYRLKGL